MAEKLRSSFLDRACGDAVKVISLLSLPFVWIQRKAAALCPSGRTFGIMEAFFVRLYGIRWLSWCMLISSAAFNRTAALRSPPDQHPAAARNSPVALESDASEYKTPSARPLRLNSAPYSNR